MDTKKQSACAEGLNEGIGCCMPMETKQFEDVDWIDEVNEEEGSVRVYRIDIGSVPKNESKPKKRSAACRRRRRSVERVNERVSEPLVDKGS